MKVYQLLNEARQRFHQLPLKKSGMNKFAGYSYFELGDFLIPALQTFSDVGLCAYISFGESVATMRIVAIEDSSCIELTSPMAEAQLKGCHPIQNLGAVETYTRRYLWVAALEIVEHDAIDGSAPKKEQKKEGILIPAMSGIGDDIHSKEKETLTAVANSIIDHFNNDDLVGAYEEYIGVRDNPEYDDGKLWMWRQLPSNIRTALRKHGESLKA